MDEDMEEVVEGHPWLDFDVDWDYEFDAPRFFDLSTEEPLAESSSAEKWFDTAETYPPSPLIMKIICDNSLEEEEVEHPAGLNDVTKEETYCRLGTVQKVGSKPRVKNHISKVSTLMKPTASYLAKKSQRYEVLPLVRNNKMNSFKSLESSGESKDCTIQATKRQRLEKGHLGKATGTAQPDLIHKTRDKTDIAHAKGNVGPSRVRLTIPREPDLQTMRRAERFQARRGLINASARQEHVQPKTTHKIHSSKINDWIEANQSRDLGGPSGVVPKAAQGCDKVSRRPDNKNPRLNKSNPKQECRSSVFFFKAEASHKKVAPSRNAVISRITKPQTTLSKLYTTRGQQNPPLTDVFNKLSLTNEAQHVSTSKGPFFLPSDRGFKDSKENIRINHLR